jgi:succinate dehydrogenase/fumarate reductase-like Fe-S protein
MAVIKSLSIDVETLAERYKGTRPWVSADTLSAGKAIIENTVCHLRVLKQSVQV